MRPRSQERRHLTNTGLSARRSELVELSPPLTISMRGRTLECPWGSSTTRFLQRKVTRVADLPLLPFPKVLQDHLPVLQRHPRQEAALKLRVPVVLRTMVSAVV